MSEALRAAVAQLLAKTECRWIHRGYGVYSCNSCGAQRDIDPDNDRETKREPCSRSCPWRLVEESFLNAE